MSEASLAPLTQTPDRPAAARTRRGLGNVYQRGVLADIRKRGNLNRPAERHGQADALEGRRVASATRRR